MGALRIHGYNNSWFTNREVPSLTSTEMRAIVAKRMEMGMLSEKSWASVPGGIPATRALAAPGARFRPYYTLLTKDRANDDDTYMKLPITHSDLVTNGWYLLDDTGSDILESGSTSRYIVNPGGAGFKEAYLEALLPRLRSIGADGVVFDMWSPVLYGGWLLSSTDGHDFKNAGYDTQANSANANALWQTAWESFYSYICAGVKAAGFHVIGNLSNPSPSKATTRPCTAAMPRAVEILPSMPLAPRLP